MTSCVFIQRMLVDSMINNTKELNQLVINSVKCTVINIKITIQ